MLRKSDLQRWLYPEAVQKRSRSIGTIWKMSLGDLSIDDQLLELRKLYQKAALAEECFTFQAIIKRRSEKDYGTALLIGSVKAGEGLNYMRLQKLKNGSL